MTTSQPCTSSDGLKWVMIVWNASLGYTLFGWESIICPMNIIIVRSSRDCAFQYCLRVIYEIKSPSGHLTSRMTFTLFIIFLIYIWIIPLNKCLALTTKQKLTI